MDIKIEIATIENLKDIQNLNLMLFEKEQKEYEPTFNLEWTFSEEGTKYFSDSINSEKSCAFVAKSEERVIGYLVGSVRKADSYRTIKDQAELDNMFVIEEFRGQKVGKKLVDKFFEWVKDKGVKNITVTASAKNEKAIDFYRKCGFEDYDHTLEINF